MGDPGARGIDRDVGEIDGGGSARRVSPADMSSHLWRMRAAVGVALAAVLVAVVAALVLPARTSPLVSPLVFTLAALAAALWLAFTADRDAGARLRRIRELFSAHGDEHRLLRQLLGVYLVVLLRLVSIAACGVVVAVWGRGPVVGVGFCVLAAVLVLLTWPTRRKSELLLGRARQLAEKG